MPLSYLTATRSGRCCSRGRIENVRAQNFKATALYLTKANNALLRNIKLRGCGKHPAVVETSSSVRLSLSSGSPNVSANENVFVDPDHVGLVLFAGGGGPLGGSRRFASPIASVTDQQHAVLDDDASANASDVVIGFEGVRGSITSGTNTLTLNADVLA